MHFSDFHTHTCFSDGSDTPEQMVREAIARGMAQLGISDHSFTAFDTGYCLPPEKTQQYKASLQALKESYTGQIELFCGMEQDYYSAIPATGYDYVLGSVHYVQCGAEYVPIDLSEEIFASLIERHFGGDSYALCERYYETVADVVAKTQCDVISHFDIITRFNAGGRFFDETHPRYVAAYRAAADALLATGKPFEINTGLMARGMRDYPYPRAEICDYIAAGGGSFLLSSDSHRKQELMFGFGTVRALAAQRGWNILHSFKNVQN